MEFKKAVFQCILAFSFACVAAPVVKVEKAGAEKITVAVNVKGSTWYLKSLKRNLELTGIFKVASSGSITVSGLVGGAVTATGRGKTVRSNEAVTGDPAARMAARRFADMMVEAFSDGAKGFATTRIAFVNRKGADNAELYTCYPDGWDMKQITSDGRAAVGPRWAPNGRDLYYTGFLHEKQLVYRIDTDSYDRECLGAFKNGAWIRVACELVEDDRLEAKKSMLDAYPNLRGMYDEKDGNTQVFYMKRATATISSFGGAPVVIEF